MATGTLVINTTTGFDAIPVSNVSFAILDKQGNVLHSGLTDENGVSDVFTLETPPPGLSGAPNPDGPRPYAVYDMWVGKPGFATINIIGVQVFPNIQSIQRVDMIPVVEGEDEEFTYIIPPPLAALPTPPQLQVGTEQTLTPTTPEQTREGAGIAPFVLPAVVIPDYVTVHLGVPANPNAANTRVRFIDYVKNVTSSEIYPDWPVNSIVANVHVVVSFVLNRIYTEWYRARGYNFDITNSTTVDQYFVPGRTIFQNISQIVDGIFNIYARRQGFRNPYFTEFCNGTTATCKGLSQWGTVTLANRGFTPIQILRNYYPNDLILTSAPSGNIIESFPGVLLQRGSTGESVRLIQTRLNRIRANYPAIPQIPNPNGVFGSETESAVRAFQKTFNLLQDGQVGRSTWNKISQIFVAVTKLAELGGEGERIGLDPNPPTVVIREGSRGTDVIHAQFILNYLAQFYPELSPPIMDSIFGPSTTRSVRAFQTRFGIAADGIIGPATWRKMYDVFKSVQGQVPPPVTPPTTQPWPPYPGYLLRVGNRGPSVTTLQSMLNNARTLYTAIPIATVDGIFGPGTERSVRTFQLYAGLGVDGVVGPATWAALAAIPRV